MHIGWKIECRALGDEVPILSLTLISDLDTKILPIPKKREKIECFSFSKAREWLLKDSLLVSWLYSHSFDKWQPNSNIKCKYIVWFSSSEDNPKIVSDFWQRLDSLFLNHITCENSVSTPDEAISSLVLLSMFPYQGFRLYAVSFIQSCYFCIVTWHWFFLSDQERRYINWGGW